jgi:dTDP-4-dehydrorhamnose 3,5-epimerase
MNFHRLRLSGAYRIELSPHGDERGEFARLFCMNELASIGHSEKIVQVNRSLTRERGSVRGMHFQYPPHAEIKLVTCLRGLVYDVLVDLREDSPTFLSWEAAELSRENSLMMYVPRGFAHGFQTLEDECELLYFHTEFYAPAAEGGVRYDDESICIEWPLPVTCVSEKDISHPKLDLRLFKGIKP